MWVLGLGPRSSGKAVSPLNWLSHLSGPGFYFNLGSNCVFSSLAGIEPYSILFSWLVYKESEYTKVRKGEGPATLSRDVAGLLCKQRFYWVAVGN